MPEKASPKLFHGTCDSDARRAAAAAFSSCMVGSPSSMMGGSIAALNGRVTNAPPAVAGRRVSVTDGRANSREMAGSEVSADENEPPPVAVDPEDENDEPAWKLNG